MPSRFRVYGHFVLASAMVAIGGSALQGQSPTIKVTLLGTAGPSASVDRPESGTLVQAGSETLLFDCGRGVPERLVQLGLANVSKVFLTHLHSDHTEGLPVLWMEGWNGRGTTNLSVWGPGPDVDQPTGTAGLTQALAVAYATNTHIRRDLVEKNPAGGIVIDAHEIGEGVVYQSNGVTVTAFLVDHAPVRPAYGYRVDYGAHSVAISGDTRPTDNLVKFAKGVDVLIHEVFLGMAGIDFRPGGAVAAYHTSPEQAAGVFNAVGAGLAVYSHLAGGQGDPTARTRAAGYIGPLVVGTDLTVISIGDRISAAVCDSAQTPVVLAFTDAAFAPMISANGSVVVSGSGFSANGGNQLIFSRQGAPTVVFDATTDASFSDLSPTQITARLGGRVTAGQWTVTVRSRCGVTSAGVTVTVP